jgi:Secretion system C-terminal sorting domain
MKYSILSFCLTLFFPLMVLAQPMPQPILELFKEQPFKCYEGGCDMYCDLKVIDYNNVEWDLNEILLTGKPIYFYFFSQYDSYAEDMLFNSGFVQFRDTYSQLGDSSCFIFLIINNIIEPEEVYCSNGGGACYDFTTLGLPVIPNHGLYDCQEEHYFTMPYGRHANNVFRLCPDRLSYSFNPSWSYTFSSYNVQFDRLESSLIGCENYTEGADAGIMYSSTDNKAPSLPGRWRHVDAVICNYGTDLLTSANIELYWGDVLVQSYTWTGSLSTFQSDTVILENLYTDGFERPVSIKTSLPNGQPDVNPVNDDWTRTIDSAYVLKEGDDTIYIHWRSRELRRWGFQLFGDHYNELDHGGCKWMYDDTINVSSPFEPSPGISTNGPWGTQGCTGGTIIENTPPEYQYGYPNDSTIVVPINLTGYNDTFLTLRILTPTYTDFNFQCEECFAYVMLGEDTLLNFANTLRNDQFLVFSKIYAVDTTTSATDQAIEGSINIVPNPAHDWVQVVWSGIDPPDSWSIIDITGKAIWSENGNAKKTNRISTASWPSGVYYLTVRLKDGSVRGAPILILH